MGKLTMAMHPTSKRIAFAVILGTIIFASSAKARDFYYFYKPDVSREQYILDRTECDRLVNGVRREQSGGNYPTYIPSNPNLTTGQNALAAGLAGLFIGLMSGSPEARIENAVERTCMADMGYARYEVERSVVREIEELDSIDQRVERYFALATATQPIGERIVE